MNIKLIFIIFLLILGCSKNNVSYWCGDHACINKKEREAYFKKTMIVETKSNSISSKKQKTEYEKILDQNETKMKYEDNSKKLLKKETKLEEKRRIKEEIALKKEAKLEEKRRIKEEIALKKEAKLEEKRRIKEEIALKKEAKLEEKRRIKEEIALKKEAELEEKQRQINEDLLAKKIEKDEKNINKVLKKNYESANSAKDSKLSLSSFDTIVKNINRKNSLRPYPDIDDIPE